MTHTPSPGPGEPAGPVGPIEPNGPAARGARAVAARLAHEYGSSLSGDVEAAIHTTGVAGGSDRYVDPVAVAALIVSAAQFAWTICIDLRTRGATPSKQVAARTLRVQLAPAEGVTPAERDRIIDLVVDETITAGEEPTDDPT